MISQWKFRFRYFGISVLFLFLKKSMISWRKHFEILEFYSSITTYIVISLLMCFTFLKCTFSQFWFMLPLGNIVLNNPKSHLKIPFRNTCFHSSWFCSWSRRPICQHFQYRILRPPVSRGYFWIHMERTRSIHFYPLLFFVDIGRASVSTIFVRGLSSESGFRVALAWLKEIVCWAACNLAKRHGRRVTWWAACSSLIFNCCVFRVGTRKFHFFIFKSTLKYFWLGKYSKTDLRILLWTVVESISSFDDFALGEMRWHHGTDSHDQI